MDSRLLLAPPFRIWSPEFVETVPYGARVEDEKPSAGDDPRLYPDPDFLYMIYIAPIPTGGFIARHMRAYIDSDLNTVSERLFDHARRDLKNSPYRVGNSFVNLYWDCPCYLYLVLDVSGGEFIASEAADFDPIIFHKSKPVYENGNTTYPPSDPNYSFYNGIITSVSECSAFRCVNYLKADAAGNDLKYPDTRDYSFSIVFLAPILGGPRKPVSIDPDGQNQGPPVRELPLIIPDE